MDIYFLFLLKRKIKLFSENYIIKSPTLKYI